MPIPEALNGLTNSQLKILYSTPILNDDCLKDSYTMITLDDNTVNIKTIPKYQTRGYRAYYILNAYRPSELFGSLKGTSSFGVTPPGIFQSCILLTHILTYNGNVLVSDTENKSSSFFISGEASTSDYESDTQYRTMAVAHVTFPPNYIPSSALVIDYSNFMTTD